MLQHLWRIFAYFIVSCTANAVYPGANLVVQGILLIAFWGTWLHTNDKWSFAQKYGKYFNWFGALALLNACYFLAAK